jgi:hypothetical protein
MATRTIARLYDSYADAQQVVRDLEAAGIPHGDISLIGRDGTSGTAPATADVTGTGVAGTTTADAPVSTAAGYRDPAAAPAPAETKDRAGTGATIGTVIGGGAGLLAGIGALAIPGVGPVIAAGWLIATLTGAGVGAAAGGILGALTNAGLSEEDAHVYAEGLRRGGNLVTVRVDETEAARVEQILNSRTYADPANRRQEYAASGWSRFDETAGPATTAGGIPPGEPPIRHM